MSAVHNLAFCARCHCSLATDNTNELCGPCMRSTIKARLLGIGDTKESGFDPGVPLRKIGIQAYAEHLGVPTEDAIAPAFDAGKLPDTLRHAQAQLRLLVHLDHLGHVAAAESLGVTRWTIQTWRNELGLKSPRALRRA